MEKNINRLREKKTVGKKLRRLLVLSASALLVAASATGTAYAAGTGPEVTMWNAIRDLIGVWIPRLGGVVIFVGGIMFALGWKNDDAEGKSRGIMTMVSGAIVTALGLMTPTFFA